MKAWHFTKDTLRDGSPVPKVGEKLVHDGELIICKSGLHASKRIIDALTYAPGHMIHRVECGGEIQHELDKLVCTERTILFTVDGEELLRKFARMRALDVIHLWGAPDVVVRYLKTGDESIRSAALDAARTAARTAVWAAARAAAWTASTAARDTALDAAWTAALAVWGAAQVKQNERLYRLVMRARG